MKKRTLFIATLLVVVAATVAVVSCKKENQDALLYNIQPAKPFTPPVVDDMNAYLKDFKQKMKDSQSNRDGEALSLEEAAWHLASVANYDFANANVPFDDIRFDTLYSNVTVTSGSVLLSDLATAYENISTIIEKFYRSLPLDEKHFRFINASISNDGSVIISLTTTFMRSSKGLDDTLYFYQTWWDLMLDCYDFFDGSPLPASTLGRSELERFLNWKESHLHHTEFPYYYTPSFDTVFEYQNEIDMYESPCYLNSRLFANNIYMDADIYPIIFYLCDSSLGLGFDNCPPGLYIIYWKVIYIREPGDHGRLVEHYDLQVQYGVRHEHTSEPGHGGN